MDHSDEMERVAHKALSAHLRAERARAGLTQGQLSDLTGIHTTTLSRIENGKLTITLEQILRVAAALGVAPGDFVNGAQVQARETRGKKAGK